MKRIAFVLIAILSMAHTLFPQNVNIPDKAFLNALIEKGIDSNKDSLISYAEAKAITDLNVFGKGISDMTGIEAFVNLIYLNCQFNQLTSLDVSANKALQILYCGSNQITSLNFSENNSFGQLDCRDNQLTALNVSKLKYIYYLHCDGNQLTCLDVTKNIYLQALTCGNNQLIQLDISENTSIYQLTCQNNQLTSLDVKLFSNLSSLNCSGNQFTSLDVSMNTSLRSMDLSFMPSLYQVCVWEVPFPPAEQEISIDKTGSPNVYFTTECLPDNTVRIPDTAFLNALIDLGVDTNKDGLVSFAEAEATDSLDVHGKNISDLTGIKAFKNLVEFSCANNQLTSLDLSKNILLTKLNCSDNLLTSLDISMNNSIQGLILADMPSLYQVCVWEVPFPPAGYEESIDTTGSPNTYFTTECLSVWIPDKTFLNALIARGVDTNRDSLISYSEAEAVITLDFFNKSIADLTGISAFKNLAKLWCWGNQISSLDISSNNKLIVLDLGNNKLTNLDVSKNTTLSNLTCSYNQLTNIDVSMNTSLTYLGCSNNQLTSIDVTKNISLSGLDCSGNHLASIDVTKNISLSWLECSDNQITNLDVSNNLSLEGLGCFENQLTNLDVSGCIVLRYLNCSKNQLANLDISTNTNLFNLNCQNNQLISLDISKNTNLGNLNCSGNQLTSLDVSQAVLSYEPVFFGGSLIIANMLGLQKVCVRELPFPPAGLDLEIDTTGSPNVSFTTECYSDSMVFIPDTAFLYALIKEGVDTNNDGLISYAEAESVISLNVSGKWDNLGSISDMTGIEAFLNLDSLYCSFNELINLDVSRNTTLYYLDCSGNQLTSLDVSNNAALTELFCYDNQLTSLDVSKNTALTELICNSNHLTSLDVSGCNALTDLMCWSNQLTSLDVSGCTNLKHLMCGFIFDAGNQLTSLDVTNNIALTELWCSNNQLSILDVSNNTALTNLNCARNLLTSLDVSNCVGLTELLCWDNKLSNLDVSKNTALKELIIGANPNLTQVCVWTSPFPPSGINVNTEGSPNVYFTTECSITVARNSHFSDLSFYPNPTHNQINLNGLNYPADIKIYNINGQLVKSFQQVNNTIDISELTTGVYILRLVSKDKTVIYKVVKE